MTAKITNGFYYMDKTYIWYKKELYRMPFQCELRFYGVKKCARWKDGYYLGTNKKSLSQLMSMTHKIDKEMPIFESDHIPF